MSIDVEPAVFSVCVTSPQSFITNDMQNCF